MKRCVVVFYDFLSVTIADLVNAFSCIFLKLSLALQINLWSNYKTSLQI